MSNMKIKRDIIVIAMLASAILAPLTSPAASASAQAGPSRQTAVTVKVTAAGKFASGLSMADFLVTENGQPQKIEGLLEIDRNGVARQEGLVAVHPVLNRTYFLYIQMYEYVPLLADALKYFFNSALLPGDTLEIQTPAKSYKLNEAALRAKSPDVLAGEMAKIIKKDINRGNSTYKTVIRELRRAISGIEGTSPAAGGDEDSDAGTSDYGVQQLLNQYKASLGKLEAMTSLDERSIMDFTVALKRARGRKVVLMLYQREFRPVFNATTVSQLVSINQDNQQILSDLQDIQYYHRELGLDQTRIAQAFCDSRAELDFLFLERTPEKFGGMAMQEQSEDLFKIFGNAAVATGGRAITGQNPHAEMKEALEGAEKYYLLYYTPTAASSGADFKKVSVRTGNPLYKVQATEGYLTR